MLLTYVTVHKNKHITLQGIKWDMHYESINRCTSHTHTHTHTHTRRFIIQNTDGGIVREEMNMQYWHCKLVRVICGNKMPTRCNRGFYCRSYCLLNIFRAPLCPSAEGYVPGLQDAAASCNRTHNPQLHTRPATWKPQHEIPHAATTV